MSTATEYKPKRWKYGVHPSVAMVQTWVATLPEKTGRSLDQWVALVKKEGPPDEARRREWLKSEHKHGTNAAWWIAERAAGKPGEDDPESYLKAADGYVEQMFAGKRAALRPIFDALMDAAHKLGRDVKACPCQTIVPLYRRHVFAQIKPATNTRIDMGFCLRGVKPTKCLLSTGGEAKSDRITHRIPITSVDGVDDEVRKYLKQAYDADV